MSSPVASTLVQRGAARAPQVLPRTVASALALLLLGCGPKSPPAAAPAVEPTPPIAADAGPSGSPAAVDDGAAACRRGEVAGCDQLAELWGSREFLPAGMAEAGRAAAAALHAGCDQHAVSSACMGLALMYKYGTATGGDRDDDTANTYWARIAELGDLNSFRGGAPSAAGHEALARTEKECADGRSRACVQLGWATYGGVQQAADPKGAFVSYARACELGSGQGCRWAGHLARVYQAAPLARAEALLLHGCETLKSQAACSELGHFLDLIRNDMTAAIPLLETACRDGQRVGCMHLAEALERAKGDPTIIAESYLTACRAGARPACASLVRHVGADCTLDLELGAGDLAARCVAAARDFCVAGKEIDKVQTECEKVKACP